MTVRVRAISRRLAFRCHEWVAGDCPTNALTADDAGEAGAALGQLHSLGLPCEDACLTHHGDWAVN